MSKFRGYNIQLNENEWQFENGLPVKDNWLKMPCGHCGMYNTIEGYDGCIGKLPNVINACCGHGNINEAYIQFDDNTELRGKEVANFLNKTLDKS